MPKKLQLIYTRFMEIQSNLNKLGLEAIGGQKNK